MHLSNIFAALPGSPAEFGPTIGFFLPMLAGHLLGDFPLQPESWVTQRCERGWRSPRLYQHALLVGVLTALAAAVATWDWRVWWLCPVVFAAHAVTDTIKSRGPDTARAFVLDQLAHFAVLLVLAHLLARTWGMPVHAEWVLWPLLVAFFYLWWGVGFFIEKATARWRAQLAARDKVRLKDAGLWIGRLERSLIFLFVLVGRYEAIGFLVAAKSVFRFGEVTRTDQRNEAEYILVGTLASFLLALLIALAFRMWLPPPA